MLLSIMLAVAQLTSAPTLSDDANSTLSPSASQADALLLAEAEERRRDAGEEMTFFEKYYPLSFDEEYHPDVEEELTTLYLMAFFLMMPWGPHVFQDFTPSLEFVYELMAIYVLHMIFLVPTFFFAWVPIIGWFGVPAWAAVNFFYLIPAAVLNAYNRDYIRQRGEGGKQRKRDEGSSAMHELPGMPTLASSEVLPSLAY